MAIKGTTKVIVSRNSIETPIKVSDLVVGDMILSHNGKKPTFKKVYDLYSYKVAKDNQRTIKFSNGMLLKTTNNQFFNCYSDYYDHYHTEIDELRPDTEILSKTGTVLVDKILFDGRKRNSYYDIFVEELHCYFCGDGTKLVLAQS